MNVFTFSGNLGNDCRIGNAGGTPVCNFSVAVKSGFGQSEQSIWIDCALWGKRAEGGLPGYLLKGQKVMVSGELGTREHEGKTYLTCRVNEITLAGSSGDGAMQQHPHQPQANHQGVTPNAQRPNSQPQQGGYGHQQAPAPSDDFDDDIPFAPVAKQYRSLLNCM